MAERNFTDGDIKALGKEIASAIGKGGGSPAPTSAVPTVTVPKESLSAFDTAMKGAGKAVDETKKAYDKVSPSLEKGLDTWRDLSKAGAGFSNDIVGMTAAAAGTRMPLGEFAGVIKENAENLSGFGGNVTRGAEEFSRLSKKMFDDYAPNTDQLRQMGLANKDLNELLMIQSVSTRSKMKDGDEKDRKLIENAMALGTEMDLMAKLTGKSREAQMEQQRKNQQDMAFEAAIRRKTIGMSADDAMEFEKNARNQLRDAQLRGQEAVFKDVFATGNIVSKEAAMQASINQEQASATMKQAQVSADKTMDAKERERQATVAAAEGRKAFDKDMQNDTKLMYASMGEQGGSVGKVMRDSMSANIEYQRNLEATATKMGIVMKTDEDRAKVQKQMEEDAKAAASGKKADGTQADASTKALVNLGARAGDVESAFMNKVVKPLNEKVNPAFEKLAEGVLGATKRGSSETKVNAAERELEEGLKGKTTTGLNKVGAATSETADLVNKVAGTSKPIQRRALGGPVEEGEPYVVGEGGQAEIFVPKTAGDIVPMDKFKDRLPPPKAGKDEGFKTIYDSMKLMNPMSRGNPTGGADGLDLSTISKDISTTISGGGESTIKGPDMKELTRPFEKSFAEFNTGFEDLVAKSSEDISDAMGGNKTIAAQAKIDEAIKAKEAAYEKLQKLWNEGSDEELNENHEKYAEELALAKENLNKVVDKSMGDLVDTLDENSSALDDVTMSEAVSAASPTPINRGITTDSFTLGPNGLPIAKPKSTSAAVPDKKKDEEGKTAEEQANAREAKAKADMAAGPQGEKSAKKEGGDSKSATLDDVVKSLNALNSKMGQLITTTESGNRDVAKAAKSNTSNLYAR
jgi:hypothetical protein